MTLKDNIKALPDEDFAQLKAWIVTTETDRRAALPAVEQARAEDTKKLWDAHPELKPEFAVEPVEVDTSKEITRDDLLASYPAWKQPQGAHDALPTGAIVTHNGDVWRTDLPTLNVWPPEEGNPHTRWVKITDQLLAQLAPADEPEISETPETEATPGTGERSTSENNSDDEPSHKEWAVNLAVRTGEEYSHDGHLWRAKLDHTTHAGWLPSAATYAVWEDLGPLA